MRVGKGSRAASHSVLPMPCVQLALGHKACVSCQTAGSLLGHRDFWPREELGELFQLGQFL